MMISVLRKSTVRPWPSVRRPSSSTCSSTLKTSGCAFSISSNRIDLIGPAAHGFGQRAAFLVADVARRRADQAGDGVLLHVFGHVDADHRVLVVEQELGQRLGQLGLADAGRAEEHERADRPVGVLQAGARAAHGGRHGLHRLVLADHALARAPSSMRSSLSRSPSSILSTGMPVQRETTCAIMLGRRPPPRPCAPAWPSLLLDLLQLRLRARG